MVKQRQAICIFNDALNYTAAVLDQSSIWLRRNDRTTVTGELRSPRKSICLNAALFNSNFKRKGFGSNPSLPAQAGD
jgi:hypothetical protein